MDLLSTVAELPSSFHGPSRRSIYDGFSWLDDDDDLDLRLTLDEYNADLKPSRPATTAGPPSLFRRRLSSNKLSFGRSSASPSRPGTQDSPSPLTDQAPPLPTHSRRTSRALSLITPKHVLQAYPASIDTTAAHYQDPEARHKLRAYLTSPQKFDEALAFGFPTDNAYPTTLSEGMPKRSQSFSRDLYMASSEKLKTFLADDNSSVYSDETSIPDLDSPITPHTPENLPSSIKLFQSPKHVHTFPSKMFEGDGQSPVASREMTLRMTLTRPDLRSRDEECYGWPTEFVSCKTNHPSQPRSQPRPFRVATSISLPENRDATKESIDQIFADIDRELSASSEGMVKRFWNRVRRF
ncbi:hypothetical protein F4861DRAFT_534647 [Xylaria intraflava]|nr:hypothetical protein F4861DRAFT_534647 [Xylaria intraflava]